MYKDKKILVTGGTGTIGRHLVKALLKEDPAVIRIFSRDEHKQFEMQQELTGYKNIRYLIGDVRDETRLLRAMEGIDYVFHLAALKHVPACEYNPFEAVKTNVLGTQNVIQSAIAAGVQRVLFTSTDKAIAPTNTYGATKLMAERLISASEFQKGPKQTIFASVRFGNVMGSRGSVIPLFKKQILEKQKVTITDMDMLRYMMTPSQAIALMLKTNEMAYGGEVFVLKMPVIELRALVEVMIDEVCREYRISKPIEIEKIGHRPGEKMFEELMTEDEAQIALELPEMYILQPAFGGGKREYTQKAQHLGGKSSPFRGEVIDKETLREWLLHECLI